MTPDIEPSWSLIRKQLTESPDLCKALVSAQSSLGPVRKNCSNSAFRGRKYADLGAIREESLPALAQNGLAVIQPVTAGGDGSVTEVTTALVHSSGQAVVFSASFSTPSEELSKSDRLNGVVLPPTIQGMGKAATYLSRYALGGLLSVVTTEDDDGNTAASGARSSGRGQGLNGAAPTEKAPASDAEMVKAFVEDLSRITSLGQLESFDLRVKAARGLTDAGKNHLRSRRSEAVSRITAVAGDGIEWEVTRLG